MQVLTCWTKELTLPQTLHILKGLAHDHFSKGGSLGAELSQLLAAEDWRGLINFKLDHRQEWEVHHLIECRQGLGFFQKLEPLEVGIDKNNVGILKFYESERDCCETNNFLRAPASALSKEPNVVRLLEACRRKIRRVLGVCPKADSLKFRFGPGATTVTTKRRSCPMNKFSSGFQCSSSMLASGLLPEYLRQVPHWLNACELDHEQWEVAPGYSVAEVDIVPGELVCVPKSAKTSRTIMIEPVLNSFVQQGILGAMNKRLAAAGLATNDQSRNAELARRGSLDGSLVTLDLSSASDLISYELVKLMLPADWFRLLCSARTGAALVEGRVIPLEKFSSMGNAYTFPLETLIFWAISTAAPSLFGINFPASDVAVYGDDIIVPFVGHKHVVWGLNVLGFKLNMEKSFVSGPFRESCGSDYYHGINVRPFYQKQLISGQTLYALHNFYFRHMNFKMAEKVLRLIPASLRLYGPDGYGDGHLLREDWPRKRSFRLLRKGYSGVSFDTFSLEPRREISRYPGDWVSPLYSVYASGRGRIHEAVPVDEAPAELQFARDGRPYWPVPGAESYRRITIYTLSS